MRLILIRVTTSRMVESSYENEMILQRPLGCASECCVEKDTKAILEYRSDTKRREETQENKQRKHGENTCTLTMY